MTERTLPAATAADGKTPHPIERNETMAENITDILTGEPISPEEDCYAAFLMENPYNLVTETGKENVFADYMPLLILPVRHLGGGEFKTKEEKPHTEKEENLLLNSLYEELSSMEEKMRAVPPAGQNGVPTYPKGRLPHCPTLFLKQATLETAVKETRENRKKENESLLYLVNSLTKTAECVTKTETVREMRRAKKRLKNGITLWLSYITDIADLLRFSPAPVILQSLLEKHPHAMSDSLLITSRLTLWMADTGKSWPETPKNDDKEDQPWTDTQTSTGK